MTPAPRDGVAHNWVTPEGGGSSSAYCSSCGKDYRDGHSRPCAAKSEAQPSATRSIEACIEGAESAWRVFGCVKCDRSGDDTAKRARAELTALLSEADAARAKAIEECAKVCDAGEQDIRTLSLQSKDEATLANLSGLACAWFSAAKRIRALAAQDRAKETP